MKSRPSRLGEQSASTSSALSRSSSLATSASASVAVNVRWSLASVVAAGRLERVGDDAAARERVDRRPGRQRREQLGEPRREPVLGAHEADPGIGRERVHVRDHLGMDDRINLAEKIALLPGSYQPGLIGYMNDYKLLVVKVDGRVRLAQARRHRRLLPGAERQADDPAARSRRRARPGRAVRGPAAASSTARRPKRRRTCC